MNCYTLISLKTMIEEIGEENAQQILSSFSCKVNRDVEAFLQEKAIDFAKRNISQTHLVMAPFEGHMAIAGYFTLANKHIQINEDMISKSLFKRICKFGTYEAASKICVVSAFLIGQLGKNFAYKKDSLITGDELLRIAYDKLSIVQDIIGGKVIYLECEDKQKLRDFYESNGFCIFGERPLEAHEDCGYNGKRLLQYLKYT